MQFEELAAGEGYADVAYIPRHDSEWPALIIELKWKQDADTAIEQILRKKYPDVMKNFNEPCDAPVQRDTQQLPPSISRFCDENDTLFSFSDDSLTRLNTVRRDGKLCIYQIDCDHTQR